MTEKYEFKVNGDEMVARVKQLIHEGNIRRVRVKQGGKVLLEMPLTVGAPVAAVSILAAPVLAALVTECTIEVEKVT